MFERFLSRNPGCVGRPIDSASLAPYAGMLPESLTYLWTQIGEGLFFDGLVRVINPADYQELADECYYRDYNDAVIPFLVTVYGDMFLYVKSRYEGLGDHVVFLNMRYGTFQIFTADVEILLNIYLINQSSLSFNFKMKPSLYARLKERLGVPDADKCFGYVPALSAGGADSEDNIQVVAIQPYIALSAQSIGEFSRYVPG